MRMSSFVFVVSVGLCCAALLLGASPASSQEKTPDHVYQRLGTVEGDIRLLLKAEFVEPAEMTDPAGITLRLPRHVFAKLCEIDAKLATLQFLNGIEAGPGLVIPASQITPSDVFAGLEQLEIRLDSLRDVYSVSERPAPSPLPTGTKPTDVYKRLLRISVLIDALNVPATVPNDVYRIAETVMGQVQILARAVGVDDAGTEVMQMSTYGPADVFAKAIVLSEDLARLAASREDLAPGGGVVVPVLPEGVIKPGNVRDGLNVVLADILEMRVRAGASEPVAQVGDPVGKTPTDVYYKLEEAQLLVEQIIAAIQAS